MTIYSLDVLLVLFGTSLLFPVQFCFFLTCILVSQEAGQVVWSSHLFENFPAFIVIPSCGTVCGTLMNFSTQPVATDLQ